MRIAILAALLLAGCSGGTIVKDRPVRVSVPVHTPCVGERPEAVASLKEKYTDEEWSQMDLRQKSAAVGVHAIELRNYSDQLDAATGACQ